MIKGGKLLPEGYRARFFTDHKTFVVCHIHKVEKITRNGKGKVKHVRLSEQPVAVGVSRVNRDSLDKFDQVIRGEDTQKYYESQPGLGKHIALQRAIDAMPSTEKAPILTPSWRNLKFTFYNQATGAMRSAV